MTRIPWIVLFLLLPAGPILAEKPNIIFIMADDLGYAEVGCYGQKKIETPSLDRLAEGGMRFTRFYSGSPVCAPSRCVLLTGKHTGHAFIRDNGELPTEGQRPIPAGTFTLGTMLKKEGYATCVIGKWGLGGPDTEGEPNRQGFDHWFGYLCQRQAHNYYPRYLWRNGEKQLLEGNDRGLTGKHYAPDLMMEEALDFIRENRKKNFFLYLATPVPHVAIQVPDDSLEQYLGRWEDPPYTGNKGYLPHPAPRAGYAAMVTRMDKGVGRILDLLKELGLEENTLVCFTSDNGPTFNGGSDSSFFESAGSLRGLKCSVYEGGIRVPMIVRWPGRIQPGSETDHVCALWDVMPTLAGIVDVKTPQDLDGLSFLPTLTGAQGQEEHDHLYWEYRSRQAQAVRMGDWKAIRRIMKGSFELYDLKEDPGETRNVADAHPEVAGRMKEIMETGRTESREFPLAASMERHTPDTKLPVIPRKGWKLYSVDSESRFNGKLGIHAFDGYAHTWWHSRWYKTEPALPHEIIVDLGKKHTIRGFCYLPRNDGGSGGLIADYAFFVSGDPERWKAPAARGRFPPGKEEKEVTFPPIEGRYVRLQGLSAQDGKPHTTVAELNILGE